MTVDDLHESMGEVFDPVRGEVIIHPVAANGEFVLNGASLKV